eukprot:COSAG06_NODE_1044_length_10979_cov_10.105331_4_plen_90_part_00
MVRRSSGRYGRLPRPARDKPRDNIKSDETDTVFVFNLRTLFGTVRQVDAASPHNVTGYQNLDAYTWLLASDSTGAENDTCTFCPFLVYI